MNNKRLVTALLVVAAAAFSLASCFRPEYVERTYTAMYRVDSIGRWGSRFIAYYTHDPAVEQEIRDFYRSLDTSLIYKGYLLLYYGERQYETWCAIDCQITEMDVVCLKDWDEEHPAGSSIKEKCLIEWAGAWDGYYTKGVFDTANRADYDSTLDAGTHLLETQKPHNYTWLFNMLIYSL